MIDGMSEEEWIRKNNQESDVRKYVRENPKKTIKDMLNHLSLKATITKYDIDCEENFIRVRFGYNGFMSLKFEFIDVNENNVDELISSILDKECGLIRGI